MIWLAGCAQLDTHMRSNLERDAQSLGMRGQPEVLAVDPPQNMAEGTASKSVPGNSSQPHSSPASSSQASYSQASAATIRHAAVSGAQNSMPADGSPSGANHALAATAAQDRPSDLASAAASGTQHTARAEASAARNNSTELPLGAQAEYLRAFDRAGITDPGERADLLAAIEATDPAYRTILLRTLRARRKPTELASSATVPAAGEKPAAANAAVANLPRARSDQSERHRREFPQLAPTDQLQDYAELDEPETTVVVEVEPEHASHGEERVADRKANASPGEVRQSHTASARSGAAGHVLQEHASSLAQAIRELEAEQLEQPHDAAGQTSALRLRLLRALAGQREAALEPVPGLTLAQQEYLSHHVYSLLALLPENAAQSLSRRAGIAAEHLETAAVRLGQSAGLVVKNLHFCSEIKGFANYATFAQEVFKPGQELLLYAELDHFATVESERGFHTQFSARYQVLDAQGKRVEERELIAAEEHCRNRRRDYFVSYRIRVPQLINPGEYTLKLIVEDQLSGQFGETAENFKVGEPLEAKHAAAIR
jgi:hypothetical protein